jgi:hypothetical protein
VRNSAPCEIDRPRHAAIYALVLIAGLAGEHYSLKASLILATILAVGSYVAFVVLLKLQFQVWPTFITG